MSAFISLDIKPISMTPEYYLYDTLPDGQIEQRYKNCGKLYDMYYARICRLIENVLSLRIADYDDYVIESLQHITLGNYKELMHGYESVHMRYNPQVKEIKVDICPILICHCIEFHLQFLFFADIALNYGHKYTKIFSKRHNTGELQTSIDEWNASRPPPKLRRIDHNFLVHADIRIFYGVLHN